VRRQLLQVLLDNIWFVDLVHVKRHQWQAVDYKSLLSFLCFLKNIFVDFVTVAKKRLEFTRLLVV
jgi:hypothetical protein